MVQKMCSFCGRVHNCLPVPPNVTKKLKSGRWVCRGCLPGLFERYARERAPKHAKKAET